MAKTDWVNRHPDFPWIWLDDPAGVERFLRARGWISQAEKIVSVEKAGEGNMNLTLRVTTESRTVILKQARPWVEKYDAIDAPWDRLVYEARFYAEVQRLDGVRARMPAVLAVDESACAILLADLGEASDLSSCYRGDRLSVGEAVELGEYLAELHGAELGTRKGTFRNFAMRELNHTHIFVLPRGPIDGLDLDKFEPGLTEAARWLHADTRLGERTSKLGEIYRAEGKTLLHGDFFPGSWLRTREGLRIIDTEFSHAGQAEHDVGVALAHFHLSRQAAGIREVFLESYRRGTANLDEELLCGFAGVEIIRRLIGVAQLPLPASSGFRRQALEIARRLVVDGTLALFDEGST